VIALVITPDGFPLAYEVLAGNTADSTTLRSFLQKIEAQYGKAQRIWVCDRGIPTEEILSEMRKADPPVSYLVGTPKGRLTKLEKDLLKLSWQEVRQGVDVKLLPQDEELYVLAQSHDRVLKERAIRRRKLKWLWTRLKEISAMELRRDELLMKLGAARSKAAAAWRLVDIEVAPEGANFSYALNRKKLKDARRREGRYLLRTNLIAYCLHVTLRARLRPLAVGLTPRAALDKFAAIQMLDVHFPTTDGRRLILSRYTELNADQKLLVKRIKLDLPPQPPPRITGTQLSPAPTHVV
jgi:hypothetical protein